MARGSRGGGRAGASSGRSRRRCCSGRDRPIVLAPRRPGARVAAAVAPRSAELGVMLPYSPLHHLLLADVGEPLVMTSGNVSDEPIAYEDDDARRAAGRHRRRVPAPRPADPDAHRRLGAAGRARAAAAAAALARRGPERARAAGAGAPATCSPAAPSSRARSASPAAAAPGSRTTSATSRTSRRCGSFEEGIAHFERLFAVAPEVVAHDLHPDYLSTTYALAREGVEHVAVQHHHAHLAAVPGRARRDRRRRSARSSTAPGSGTDGTVWGGEILVGDLRGFERAGHLWPVRLPGRRPGRARAVADGVRVADGGRVPAYARPLGGVDPRALARGRADGGDRHRRAA